MSLQTALDNIYLRPSPRWAHTEYSLEYHKNYLAKRTRINVDNPDLMQKAYDKLKIDFLWYTNDGLINLTQAGRTTDMGHAGYAMDDSDLKQPSESPFHSEQEVWEIDAVAEYGLPDFGEQVRSYENLIQKARLEFPDQLIPGGYYKTIVSGAIAAFGWDMLLLAASDPIKMEKVFESFFRRTLFFMQAWAKTSVQVVIQHDDFVWASGPFMAPEIYREIIIPMYTKLWKPIHEAGKKVLFCSDGNFMELAGDVADAGADGFIFEPCNGFDFMVDNFGKTKCLIGSYVDCRDLVLGNWKKVKQDIDRTFKRLSHCKGAIVAVGNHLSPNIPKEMLDRYFKSMLSRLER
jgi:hypothetical protein